MSKADDVRELLDKLFHVEDTKLGEGKARPFVLADDFPDEVLLISYPFDKYYQINLPVDGVDTWGLVCFSTMELISLFIRVMREEKNPLASGAMVRQVSFDKAREIGKARPNVNVLFLMDDPERIHIHWIR